MLGISEPNFQITGQVWGHFKVGGLEFDNDEEDPRRSHISLWDEFWENPPLRELV